MNATMNATTPSLSVRLAAFAGAILTSAVVLGSTVSGLQPHDEAGGQVVALERVTVTAMRSN